MELPTSESDLVESASEGMANSLAVTSLYYLITVTTVYALLFCTGILGNVATCVVIVRRQVVSSPMNYYLLHFAAADLLQLTTAPMQLYLIWRNHPHLFDVIICVVRGIFAGTASNAALLIITMLTIERYLVICHPYIWCRIILHTRIAKQLVFTWILAVCFAAPQAVEFTLTLLNTDLNTIACFYEIPRKYLLLMSLFFMLPMTLIVVFHALTWLYIGRYKLFERNHLRVHGSIGNNYRMKLKKETKLLVTVLLSFFICRVPYHLLRLLPTYLPPVAHKRILDISEILYFMSMTINPLMYNLISKNFREAFKKCFTRNQPEERPPCDCRCKSIHPSKFYKVGHNLPNGSNELELIELQPLGKGLRRKNAIKRRTAAANCRLVFNPNDADPIDPRTSLVIVNVAPSSSRIDRCLNMKSSLIDFGELPAELNPPKRTLSI